ncbi:fungal-specific transcription factor domain-containing protein [Aspergillus floccosus]
MSTTELTGSRPRKKRTTNKDRVRVTRACDDCKRKKLRCSGTIPCTGCVRLKAVCQYTADYTRGRLPPIPPLSPSSVSHVVPAGGVEDVQSPRDQLLQPPSSPDAAQEDLEGHYVGPSSGVSFLLRVQKRLHEDIVFSPSIPIFNFGDSPLPHYDSSFLVLPAKDEARALVARYFDFAFPTHRFLHRPQVEEWLEEFYQGLYKSKSPGKGLGEKCAVILMVLAQAKQYLPHSETAGAAVNSTVYFAESEHHLSTETGPVRLTSVQARLAQCFFLLSESRINHCWSLFGVTARLAIAIGLHRKKRPKATAFDLIDQECRKRLFWCAYSLDNYLSAALGRPRSFHDDDIDQELPMCVDDAHLTTTAILPRKLQTQSIMLAPVYHARLSRIISGILHDLYGIKQLNFEDQVLLAAEYESRLQKWRDEITSFIDLPSVHLLMVIYQRQYNVLNLAYSHAQILLYRPFILKNFAVLATISRKHDIQLQGTIHTYVRKCLDAAMKVVSIVRDLCTNGRMYPAFWIGRQAQHDLATCGSKSSFAQRYVVILEELRKEALGALQRKGSAKRFKRPADIQREKTTMEGNRLTDAPSLVGEFGFLGESPDSYIAELTGWGEFDCLAATGLGEFGSLFPRDDDDGM